MPIAASTREAVSAKLRTIEWALAGWGLSATLADSVGGYHGGGGMHVLAFLVAQHAFCIAHWLTNERIARRWTEHAAPPEAATATATAAEYARKTARKIGLCLGVPVVATCAAGTALFFGFTRPCYHRALRESGCVDPVGCRALDPCTDGYKLYGMLAGFSFLAPLFAEWRLRLVEKLNLVLLVVFVFLLVGLEVYDLDRSRPFGLAACFGSPLLMNITQEVTSNGTLLPVPD